jgi:hypothetical protein
VEHELWISRDSDDRSGAGYDLWSYLAQSVLEVQDRRAAMLIAADERIIGAG